jgi:NADP-dependent 3-hydroxy acid dehydrogenase YdfG
MMNDDLKGLNIIITGAGRGLGAAFAICLADLGANIILCGRSATALSEVAETIKQRTRRTSAQVIVNLADVQSVEAACSEIAHISPVVDILINNGAGWLEGRTTPYSASEIATVIGSAITGTFLLTQSLLPSLQRSTRPDVVMIGSISGLPNGHLHNVSVPFYAAKHGQTALADGLRQVLIGTPVRSICIHPPYLKDVSPLEAEWEMIPDQPKGAPATNRDVVDAVIFAITRPRHITIASLVIDSDKGGLFSFGK